MADKILYIKVSKIDGDGVDQTFTLQSLQQITIPWGVGNSTETFEIFSITELQNHFLYGVNPNNVLDPVTVTNDRAKIEYDFSSSVQLTPVGTKLRLYEAGGNSIIKQQAIPLINPVVDNLEFYIPSSSNGFNSHAAGVNPDGAYYQLNTYPQKLTEINFSGSLFLEINYPGPVFTNAVTVGLAIRRQNASGLVPISVPSSTQIFNINASSPVTSSFTGSFHLSMSYGETSVSDVEALSGDKVFPYIQFNPAESSQTASFSSDTFFDISSSAASGPSIEIIPEPFQSENFSNAFDCQPLYGNATENQTSYKWMQVDHSTGIMIPINFDLIINGGALKAQVQDSNYSSLAHITPRYLGSKNQSPQINKWINSEFNVGNFGRTTSVELDKTSIAYSKWVGGWPPEKSNASTVKILHLINEDGNLFTPGASKNFLPNLQGNFESGDNVIITPINVEGPAEGFTRKVLRSGQTIKPYFYNQIEYAERDGSAEFTSSLKFEEINPAGTAITENYSVGLNVNGNLSGTGVNAWADLPRISVLSTGSDVDPSQISGSLISYTINSALIATNIQSLTFDLDLDLSNINTTTGTFYTKLVRIRGANEVDLITTPAGSTYTSPGNGYVPSNDNVIAGYYPLQFRHTVPISQIQDGDIFKVQFIRGQTGVFPITNSPFRVSQSPSPTPDFILSGSGENLFNTFEGIGILNVLYPNSIYVGDIKYTQPPLSPITTIPNPTGSAFLSTYYNNENVKQTDIPNSGYNNIDLPIKFEVGDEVRFEGDKTFMVQDVDIFTSSSLSVLLITLDSQIINTGIDINKFSFTRYVEDPTSIIIEGFKPQSSEGPYLVRPEYITNKLDNNIDSYIII